MGKSSDESFYSARWVEWRLESSLNARSECAKVADALNFVIGQLDAEMIFEAREQFKGLQTIDPELFVEIVA